MVIFYCGELIRPEKESARRQMGGGRGGGWGDGIGQNIALHHSGGPCFSTTYACLPRSKYKKINKYTVYKCVRHSIIGAFPI
jgi:hypothetical protein